MTWKELMDCSDQKQNLLTDYKMQHLDNNLIFIFMRRNKVIFFSSPEPLGLLVSL